MSMSSDLEQVESRQEGLNVDTMYGRFPLPVWIILIGCRSRLLTSATAVLDVSGGKMNWDFEHMVGRIERSTSRRRTTHAATHTSPSVPPRVRRVLVGH